MAWFVSRRNCPSFLTANTVAGPLGSAHRSGRAGGDHQDPAAAVLLYRRTPHPLGTSPHLASSPALALGSPVQSRSSPIASHGTPCLTAAATGPPPSPTNPTETSPNLAPDRPASVSCCVLSLAGGLHMTVANRSSAPTIQNLPANRSSMSHIPRSATAITPFGGFELKRFAGRRLGEDCGAAGHCFWCLRLDRQVQAGMDRFRMPPRRAMAAM